MPHCWLTWSAALKPSKKWGMSNFQENMHFWPSQSVEFNNSTLEDSEIPPFYLPQAERGGAPDMTYCLPSSNCFPQIMFPEMPDCIAKSWAGRRLPCTFRKYVSYILRHKCLWTVWQYVKWSYSLLGQRPLPDACDLYTFVTAGYFQWWLQQCSGSAGFWGFWYQVLLDAKHILVFRLNDWLNQTGICHFLAKKDCLVALAEYLGSLSCMRM